MWEHVLDVFRTLRLFETSKFHSNPCHVKTHLSVGSHMAGWTGFEPATTLGYTSLIALMQSINAYRYVVLASPTNPEVFVGTL